MADEYDSHRELTFLVHSLRRTIEERPPRGIGTVSNLQWRSALLAFEEVRVILRQSVSRGRQRPLYVDLLREAHEKLISIASDPEIISTIEHMTLLLTVVPRGDRPVMESYRGMSAIEALHIAIDLSGSISLGEQRSLELAGIDEFSRGEIQRLERIIPKQKVSPVKFGIAGAKVVVLPQNHASSKSDAENVKPLDRICTHPVNG